MADTVDVRTVGDFKRHKIIRLTNESDGTGETNVAKVDISALTDSNGATATYSAIDRIVYSVDGFNYVVLRWDHTADDEIAVLKGQGDIDLTAIGGLVDPQTTGGTGDILLSTDGGSDGSSYDITLYLRPKA